MTVHRTGADTGLIYVLVALDIIAEMALDPEQVHQVAACKIKVMQVKSRAELILRLVEAAEPPPTTVRRDQ